MGQPIFTMTPSADPHSHCPLLVMGLPVFTMTPSKQKPTGQTQPEQETSFKDIAPMAGILTILAKNAHID